MYACLLIYHNHQTLFIIESNSAIDVSFDSITIFINEFHPALLISNQLIAIPIKSMYFTFSISL